MEKARETSPELGVAIMSVYKSGRNGWHRGTSFTLDCDAVALHINEILLLSIVGSETSVKAMTAALQSSGKVQKRIEYSVQLGPVHNGAALKSLAGYRCYRTKLAYGLWHVLCLAKRPEFMPVFTEESLWQHLQSQEFTTPIVRSWMPWLMTIMKQRRIVAELTQHGCHAGLLECDNKTLDALVSEGLQKGQLTIADSTTQGRRRRQEASTQPSISNLDEYMLKYGSLLGKQAEHSLEPLHVPGRDPVADLHLEREPFAAQTHVIEAVRKALRRQKALLLVGEMGSGKTLMGMAAIHAHAAGKPYRALVFCPPGQLIHKWEREIRETIGGAQVSQIENWKSLLHLDRTKQPADAEWFVIARDRAKLGPRWNPSVLQRHYAGDGFLRCPQCGLRLVNDQKEPVELGEPGTGLWKRRQKCEWVLSNSRSQRDPEHERGDLLQAGCGSPLWQMNGELRRYEPALYIKRHLRHFFKYLVLDEVHEEKGADTAQGHAAGALAAACAKVIALTGTLIGGYAEHLRPLLFRLSPGSLLEEGLAWSQATAFSERYGRIETRITERSGVMGEDHRMSRGSNSSTKSVRPGIMPTLFGRHLIDKTVFLGLAEVADNLPVLTEECVSVAMDDEVAAAYREGVEKPLAEAIKEMVQRKDRRLLGTMIQTLLAYPDYPYGWDRIGYWDRGGFVAVASPPNLNEVVIRPKERALIDLITQEKSLRRKVWVYVQFTDKHDVQSRLERLLREAGLQVGVLWASVPLAKREAWIAEHAPGLDVVISHPRLVETGLDLFDKNGGHNFPTICFYEAGYNLFTMRQASRRAWRIGQQEPCRIVYFYYEGTMQDRAMALMGKKLTAAQALEGTFSSEGLVALAGEDANVEMALARSLVERMDEGDARRSWSRVFSPKPLLNSEPAHLDLWMPEPDVLPFPKQTPPQARGAEQRACAGMLF